MNFGIPDSSIKIICDTLLKIPEIEKAAIFGSRAMGNYKNGSDVDLVIYGSKVTVETINKLSIILNEEVPLPYYFDVVNYESLDNQQMKIHLDTYARIFYTRT